MTTENTYDILWTGGLDSTFRVLYSLLVEYKNVNLFYIYDHRRRSRHIELRRMKKIIKKIKRKYPNAADRMSPLHITRKDEIAKNAKIESMYNALKSKCHIGSQYRWLAQFAEAYTEKVFELCLEKYDKADNTIGSIIAQNTMGLNHQCKLGDEMPDPDLALFSKFRFPTIHLTKVDMVNIAKQHGFQDILQMTWFCHNPLLKIIPCGRCKPCILRIESGLSTGSKMMDMFLRLKAGKRWTT